MLLQEQMIEHDDGLRIRGATSTVINDIQEYWEQAYSRQSRDDSVLQGRIGLGNREFQREKYFFSKLREDIAGKTLLDVGCGTAISIRSLLPPKRLNYSYVGIDFSDRALQTARSNVEMGTFIRSTLPAIPNQIRRADYVLCFGVLMYVSEWRLALDRLIDLLAPGGRLMLYETVLHKSWFAHHPSDGAWPSFDQGKFGMDDLLAALKMRGRIEFFHKDYSLLRFVLVKFLGRVMDRSLLVSKLVVYCDYAFIATLGRLWDSFDGRCVFVTFQKGKSSP